MLSNRLRSRVYAPAVIVRESGDPVIRSASDGIGKARRTGYPAGASHRARRRRDPVAGYDGSQHLASDEQGRYQKECTANHSVPLTEQLLLVATAAFHWIIWEDGGWCVLHGSILSPAGRSTYFGRPFHWRLGNCAVCALEWTPMHARGLRRVGISDRPLYCDADLPGH